MSSLLTRETAAKLRCIVAMPTAFQSNGLDATDAPICWTSQRKLVDFLVDNQVDALLGAGTTGEAATMSHEEQIEYVAGLAKYMAGRCPKMPLIAGGGSNCTAEAVRLTKLAIEAGAWAVLSVMPYYNKPTPEGQFLHFSKIAETGFPIILYSVSSRTGRPIDIEVVGKLAEAFPNIIGIKDAESPARFEQLRQRVPKDFIIWSGNDDQTFEAMKAGNCDGVVSVVANAVPEKVKKMVEIDDSDFSWKAAAAINSELGNFARLMFIKTNPIPVKHALAMLAVFLLAKFRSPMVELTENGLLNDIRQELISFYGVIPDAKQ